MAGLVGGGGEGFPSLYFYRNKARICHGFVTKKTLRQSGKVALEENHAVIYQTPPQSSLTCYPSHAL
jgi:hypothetical protein